MVNDPWAVLGVAKGADQDEIKRAYRRKAKECHPDLHPDDPHATEKMNEINEAYDMLLHPEKYAQRQQQSNPYGAYGNPFGQQGSPYGQQQYGQQGNPYGQQGNPFGGYTFDFGDLFGFGFGGNRQQVPPPQEQPGDIELVRQAVRSLNARQYQAAAAQLNAVVSTQRNGRWYYLSALAQHGLGNELAAAEQIQRAVQMEPTNQQYQMLLNRFRAGQQTYQQYSGGYDRGAAGLQRLCMGLCLAQLLCGGGCCFPCGMGYY